MQSVPNHCNVRRHAGDLDVDGKENVQRKENILSALWSGAWRKCTWKEDFCSGCRRWLTSYIGSLPPTVRTRMLRVLGELYFSMKFVSTRPEIARKGLAFYVQRVRMFESWREEAVPDTLRQCCPFPSPISFSLGCWCLLADALGLDPLSHQLLSLLLYPSCACCPCCFPSLPCHGLCILSSICAHGVLELWGPSSFAPPKVWMIFSFPIVGVFLIRIKEQRRSYAVQILKPTLQSDSFLYGIFSYLRKPDLISLWIASHLSLTELDNSARNHVPISTMIAHNLYEKMGFFYHKQSANILVLFLQYKTFCNLLQPSSF